VAVSTAGRVATPKADRRHFGAPERPTSSIDAIEFVGNDPIVNSVTRADKTP
jgi:hypothetical protein